METMSKAEYLAFLSAPARCGKLATVRADGRPHVVPIWFIHRNGKLWFTPRARSAWFDDLRKNPGVCCTIDESGGLLRKVIARGTATIEHEVGNDDAWRDLYRDITMRYVPESFGEAYLTDTHDEPRGLVSLQLAGAQVSTWRMPGKGEDKLAVWAPKYYHRA